MEQDFVLQNSSNKGVMNYETVFNIHVMNSNKLFQSVTSQKGIGITVIMSLLATVMALDGMIRNKRQPEEYDAKIRAFIEDIKKDFKLLGDSTTDDEKFVNTWFKVLDAYNFQLQQMNALGLTPAEDVDDILPTIAEKVERLVEVPQWKPTVGDYEYKQDLDLPQPKDVEYKTAPIMDVKPGEEMSDFERRIAEARVELALEMQEKKLNGEE